eukprot:1949507-Karenia_brevis.AAC.1
MAEALWPLARRRRGPQAPLGRGDEDGDDERRRADAVVSKCASSSCSSALQLLMSPGVAPATARTLSCLAR